MNDPQSCTVISDNMTVNEFDAQAAEWEVDPKRQVRAQEVADSIASTIVLEKVNSLLEYGAGTGLLSRALQQHLPTHAQVTLMDSSVGMVKQAREIIAAQNLTWTATVADLSQPGQSIKAEYDLITSLLALHHVADVAQLLASFRRALKPHGKIALVDLVEDHGLFHHRDGIQEPHRFHDGFNIDQLRKLIIAAGFAEPTFATCFIERRIIAGAEVELPLFLTIAEVVDGNI